MNSLSNMTLFCGYMNTLTSGKSVKLFSWRKFM